MLAWDKNIPVYLTEKKNIISFVLFTAVFALVFINVYAPFGSDKWLNISEFQFFVYSSLVVLIGIMVIAISRLILFLSSKSGQVSYKSYGIWIVIELISMSLVYGLVQLYYINPGGDLLKIFLKSLRITTLVIMPTYIIYWLYASLLDKYLIIESLKSNEPRPINGGKINLLIPFHDEKGNLKFSIKKEDLLFLEADDNYVNIHYLELGKINKYLIRNTLKKIEKQMEGSGLIRCHRSYMVNFDRVKILKKEKEGMVIEFDQTNSIIPISKTYLDHVIQFFYKNSTQ